MPFSRASCKKAYQRAVLLTEEKATPYTLHGKKPAEPVRVGDDPRKEILRCAEKGAGCPTNHKVFYKKKLCPLRKW